tara:strand:- start:1258 stop:1362 length:105 start_codon:yes stop_codon:yes gene_type:complete
MSIENAFVETAADRIITADNVDLRNLKLISFPLF